MKYWFNQKSLKKYILLLVVGLGSGILAVAYRLLLDKLNHLRGVLFSDISLPRIIFLVILFSILALIAGYLVKKVPLSSGSGIPQIQGELQDEIDAPPVPIFFSKVIGGGINNLAGLSLGREGPSIQLGGMFGKWVASVFHQNKNKKILMTAGASAGLAAAFNAPISGVIFAMEELHKRISPIIVLPCLISAAVADYLSKQVFGLDASFGFMNLSATLPLNSYISLLGIGLLTGVGGHLFTQVILLGQDIQKKIPLPFRLLPSFMLSLVIGIFTYDVLGGGHHLIHELQLQHFGLGFLILLLVLKYIFTGISYGSSAQGGIFLPVLAIGGLIGNIYGLSLVQLGLLDKEHIIFMMMLAMVGILTSVLRCPLLSIVLVMEMTGLLTNLLSLMIVAIVSYIVAGLLNKESIYELLLERLIKSQKENAKAE